MIGKTVTVYDNLFAVPFKGRISQIVAGGDLYRVDFFSSNPKALQHSGKCFFKEQCKVEISLTQLEKELLETLKTIRDAYCVEGELYEGQVEDLKFLVTSAIEKAKGK